MKPTFPLLRLPDNVIIKVLENLRLRQLFFISLLSTNVKNHVTSLGLRVDCVNIFISRMIRLVVFIGRTYFHFIIYNDSNDQNAGALPADITLPVAPGYLRNQDPIIQLTTPLFNFSKWLNHIRTVFCYNKPPNLIFDQGCERFELRSLKASIRNVDLLVVFIQSPDIQYKNILKFFNAPNKMYLQTNPFEDTCQIQQIFIQNFQSLAFHDVYSLDDMLLINSEKVEFSRPISQKQFNQFLKHWIRGSNPRLQRISLKINLTDFARGEVYLKGIKCMEMSEEAKNEICHNHRLSNVNMVQIRRNDGTTAVIATKNLDGRLSMFIIP
ncbi:hypothetical protein GCK72_008549 [Caenorhabditis remanei]|uniref:F-box domain-containing protein n=1 Tax=Caenorhabditis remanei TaxID=31234 RepID=A0A6A5H1G5_CAERE|nr:hypothetical protein GCK72_008549 [Caenorhabditis remanei]KAF1760302.1 hypothetical protein GCK72_008549 [Caenorhabditis remanei]